MRTEAKRRKINRLYILGAGSSYSLTQSKTRNHIAPLDKQFCKRISNLSNCSRPIWVKRCAELIKKEYLHHIDFDSIGLEELIRQQISDYDFIKSIHPRRTLGRRTQEQYLNDIIHLVSYILKSSRPKKQSAIEKWLKRCMVNKARDRSKNRIITFNYDTVIDDILLRWYKPQDIYFDNIWSNSATAPKRRKNRYPLLVKLHGSINWRCTKTEYKKLFTDIDINEPGRTNTYNTQGCHYIEKVWVEDKACSPNDSIVPLIIPPLPQKPITSIAIFRYLWSYAYEYLYEAKNIVIAGYSLPATDTLAVSLFSKFKNKRVTNITVIDPNEEILGKWFKLFRRIGIKKHDIHYFPDFAEYIENRI